MIAQASGNDPTQERYETDMTEKKRTTVTTIETVEVWTIRRVVPAPGDEHDVLISEEIAQPTVPSLSEVNNSSGTNDDRSTEG